MGPFRGRGACADRPAGAPGRLPCRLQPRRTVARHGGGRRRATPMGPAGGPQPRPGCPGRARPHLPARRRHSGPGLQPGRPLAGRREPGPERERVGPVLLDGREPSFRGSPAAAPLRAERRGHRPRRQPGRLACDRQRRRGRRALAPLLVRPLERAIRWETNESRIQDLVFSSGSGLQSRWLVAVSSTEVFRCNLRLDELLDLACRMAGRNLTRDEWAQFLPGEEYRKTCPVPSMRR